MLFPRKNDELLNLVSTRVSDQNVSISREITKLICQIIEKELNLIEELADLADEMKNSKDFTTYEAFLRIENRNSKYINENTLSNFMKRNGYVLNQRDSFGIIYKLDNDGDGKISYEEFQEIFFPLKYAKISTIEFRPRIEETTRNEINYDGDYDRTLSYANVFNNSNSTTFKYSNSNYYSAYQTGDIRYKRTIDMNKQNEEENEKESKNEQIENNQNYDDSKNEKNDLNNNEILNSEENEQNSQNENKVSEKEQENENERVIKINQNGNTITEENELSSNRLKTSYNDYLELRNSRIKNQNNFYNSNSNLNPNNKYSLLSSTVRSPVQSYSRENLNRSKENLSSTLSSLRMGSPLKYSTNYNDELNARANLKTYTSPEKYRYISPERGVESASRMFNSRLDLSSNNIRTPNMNRSNTIERCDIKPRIVQLESKSPNIENSFAFNSSQRFFSPSRLNTTKYSGNYTFTTNARTNNLDVLSPRKNIDRTNVSYNKDKGYVLAKFLSDILSYDGISEVYRESISLKTEINLPDLFALFNFSNRNSISLVDFKEILKELDIYSSLNELKLVFKRYDINMDGRLE
jgi:Ca2+-binding EF-hand superfamily protein